MKKRNLVVIFTLCALSSLKAMDHNGFEAGAAGPVGNELVPQQIIPAQTQTLRDIDYTGPGVIVHMNVDQKALLVAMCQNTVNTTDRADTLPGLADVTHHLKQQHIKIALANEARALNLIFKQTTAMYQAGVRTPDLQVTLANLRNRYQELKTAPRAGLNPDVQRNAQKQIVAIDNMLANF